MKKLPEAMVAVLLTLVAASVFYTLYGRHDTALLTDINDVWFQSDLKRVFENMTDRFARGHYRVKVIAPFCSSRILPRPPPQNWV